MTDLIDAHNHLQDHRLGDDPKKLMKSIRKAGITQSIVNGTCQDDWPRVADLARQFPEEIIPSFGLHPWRVQERTDSWLSELRGYLEEFPGAGVGEIGLDRWIDNADTEAQATVFLPQLRLAVDLSRPVTIHCLQAWGQLLNFLKEEKQLPAKFLLHSFGGSAEMAAQLKALGAYFSASAYFLHPKKIKQLSVLSALPKKRLLLETDAPDMVPPSSYQKLGTADLNHPADFSLTAPALAKALKIPLETLQENARSFFL